MSKTITNDNFESIKGVKFGDDIVFQVGSETYYYCVHDRFIRNRYGTNEQIFNVLCIEKKCFCDHAYGYDSIPGDCPECKPYDYAAILNLIKALFYAIREQKKHSCQKNYSRIVENTNLELKLINSKTFKIVL